MKMGLLRALDRCEFKAGYNALTGWQLSAKGALPIMLIAFAFLADWMGQF